MQSKQERIEKFKNKFYDLLNAYGADISFDCDYFSDTYGIYDPKIVVTIRDPDDFKKEIVVIESKGYSIEFLRLKKTSGTCGKTEKSL